MTNNEAAKKIETARHEIIQQLDSIGIDPRIIEDQLQRMMQVEGELYGDEDWSKFSDED